MRRARLIAVQIFLLTLATRYLHADVCSNLTKHRAPQTAQDHFDQILETGVGIDPSNYYLYVSNDEEVKAYRGGVSRKCPSGGANIEFRVVYSDQLVVNVDARDFVFAHEIAHLVNGDRDGDTPDRNQELVADFYAAKYLVRLGWTPDRLINAIKAMNLPDATVGPYPSLEQRIATIRRASQTPEPETSASIHKDYLGHVYDLPKAYVRNIWTARNREGYMSAAFDSRSNFVISYAKPDKLDAWDIDTGSNEWKGKSLQVDFLGQHLMKQSKQGTMDFLTSTSGLEALSGDLYDRAVSMSPDGQQLAVGIFQGIDIIDLRTKAVSFGLSAHSSWVTKLVYSPDGRYLISAGGNAPWSIIVWNMTSGEKVAVIDDQGSKIEDIRTDPQTGDLLVLTLGQLLRYQIPSAKLLKKIGLPGDAKSTQQARISPNCDIVVIGGETGFDIRSASDMRKLLHLELPAAHQPNTDIDLSALAIDPTNSAIVYGLTESIKKITGQSYYYETMADYLYFSSLTQTQSAQELEHSSWQVLDRQGHLATIKMVEFSPNGKSFVSGSYDGNLVFWRVNKGVY